MERSPKTLVVDASTVVKWFVQETDSDKASVLKTAHQNGDLQLTAPDLLIYEVSNALNYNPKMRVEEIVGSINRLFELDIDLIPPSMEFTNETCKFAQKHNIAIYDASYVTLADMIGTNCVTADGKLQKKLSDKKSLYLLATLGKEWDVPR